MEEIKKYITSSDSFDIAERNDNDYVNNNLENTLTLTKIVKQEEEFKNKNNLDEIKKEISLLKDAIDNNNNLIKEILLKIK